MPVQTLYAGTPLQINKTFDKVWIEEVVISAQDPNADAIARVRLRLFRDTPEGRELSEQRYELVKENVLSSSAEDQDLDNAVTALMGYIAKLAVTEGIVANVQ